MNEVERVKQDIHLYQQRELSHRTRLRLDIEKVGMYGSVFRLVMVDKQLSCRMIEHKFGTSFLSYYEWGFFFILRFKFKHYYTVQSKVLYVCWFL